MALFMNFNLLDHAAKTDGFYSLNLEPVLRLFAHVELGTNQAAGLKDFLGISHTSNVTNSALWDTRTSFMPLVSTGQRPVFAAGDEALDAVLNERFNPRNTVYLPLQARDAVAVPNRPNARIESCQFSPEQLNIEVAADTPAIVVVAQAFYPCWQAYVDGRPTALWPANYAFQALAVPAGHHHLRLRYEDKRFAVGATVSLIFLAACTVGWILSGSRWRFARSTRC
jgi:hypothetical protein